MPAYLFKKVAVTMRYARHASDLLWKMQTRERLRLWQEMQEMRGLLPLLMKPRNGQCWTEVDRRRIRVHLRKLVELSPYMVLFVAPGGFFMLPILVWWLDRRHPAQVVVVPPQLPDNSSSEQHS